jgi:ribosomal subunit interface protein
MDVREVEVGVTTRGEVPEAAREYATEKIAQLARLTDEPILFAQVKLTLEPNPARQRPALAEATLDVNGSQIRAHVAADQFEEAVDLLEGRLRRSIAKAADRLDRETVRHPPEGRPPHRPEHLDRPVEEREVVRHKTFALEPMRWDEAAFDLEVLGHDFYLFTELDTGADCVISHTDGGGTEILPGDDEVVSVLTDAVAGAPGLHVGPVAPALSLSEAEERLDVGHEPFVFFVDPDTARGQVVYRRFDGHYGLITPG